DGTTRYFDLSTPEAPKQTYTKVTGKQVNMISQSWDGTRVYLPSSLLANWDKGGADNEQFLRGFTWDGKELKQVFEVDFTKEQLGRAHHMKLGSNSLKSSGGDSPREAGGGAARGAGRRRGVGAGPRGGAATASARLRAARGGHLHAAPHHGGARRGSGGRGWPAATADALHARGHHAARVHLHQLHRSRGVSAGVPGLRRPEAIARGAAIPTDAGPAGDA